MYTEETIAAALEAVKTNELSERKAATKFGIPRGTLRNRLRNNNKSRHSAHEEQMVLSLHQEELIVDWIWMEDSVGRAPTHENVRELAEALAAHQGKTDKLGDKWTQRFLNRHPEVKIMRGRRSEAVQRKGNAHTMAVDFFAIYKRYVDKYKVNPSHIYNMDETGFHIGVSTNGNDIAPSFKRSTYVQSPEIRDYVSVIECISASGVALKPTVIFKAKGMSSDFVPKPVPDWQYNANEIGWMTSKIGLHWLDDIFLPTTAPENSNDWRLLIMDNNGSHCTAEFMAKCLQHNVALLYLPPHALHVLQPLDDSCFSSIKAKYSNLRNKRARGTDSATVMHHNFITHYQEARQDDLTPSNIKKGFENAGLWPMKAEIVLESSLVTESPQSKQAKRPLPQDNDEILLEHPVKYLKTLQETYDLGPEVSKSLSALVRHLTKQIEHQGVEVMQLKKRLALIEKEKVDREHVSTQTGVDQDSNARFWTAADFDEAHRREEAKSARRENAGRRDSEAAEHR